MGFSKWTLTDIIEAILALRSLAWGILFLFPEDTLGRGSQLTFLKTYANDTVWGIVLVVGSCFLIFFPRTHFFVLRRITHLVFWLFWLGITLLIYLNSLPRGTSV